MADCRIKDGIATVDIHQMYAADAKKYLERLLTRLPAEVERVEVSHGYNSGDALMAAVRTEVRSRRIKRRGLSTNPGITIYYLK